MLAHNCSQLSAGRSSVQSAVAQQPLALCSANSKVSSLTLKTPSSHRPSSHPSTTRPATQDSASPRSSLRAGGSAGVLQQAPSAPCLPPARHWSSGPCSVRPFVRPSAHSSVHCARRRASSGARSAALLHDFLNRGVFHDPTVLPQSLILASGHPPASTVVLSIPFSASWSELVLQHVLACRVPHSSSSVLHQSATRCEGRLRAARCASSSLRSWSSRCCTASCRRCTYRRSCLRAIAACTFVFILLV